MYTLSELGPRIIIQFSNGLYITESVIWTWIIMIGLIIASLILTRNLKNEPGKVQALLETGVELLYSLVETTMGKQNSKVVPYFVGFLIFVFFCNVMGILGIRSTTADVNTTFAMGIIAFVLIQGMAIKKKGMPGHIKHMSEPYAFMFPINLIGDLALPISLAFRLFGNILGGVIVMTLCYEATASLSHMLGMSVPIFGLLLPIPLNIFFDLFEPALQAFVFAMLTMTFIGINTQVEEI